MPSSLAIVGVTFDGEACGRAIGIWAAAVGPVLGGWLVDAVSWRMIFFLNLPVAAGAIASGASLYPRGRRERWGAPGPVERVAGDRWPRRPDGFLPYVLIETGHYPEATAGAALLPLPLVMPDRSSLSRHGTAFSWLETYLKTKEYFGFLYKAAGLGVECRSMTQLARITSKINFRTQLRPTDQSWQRSTASSSSESYIPRRLGPLGSECWTLS
jgi:MFS family permease